MTTREAFQVLVQSPYLWKKTGQAKTNRRTYKLRISKDDWPTTDTMMQLLTASGFVTIQEP
jgi:hypothetical protein